MRQRPERKLEGEAFVAEIRIAIDEVEDSQTVYADPLFTDEEDCGG